MRHPYTYSNTPAGFAKPTDLHVSPFPCRHCADVVSPEGLAVDVKRRLMFWVDSNPDMIESSNLDGSGRRTLFDTELVNPRAIIVVSSTG